MKKQCLIIFSFIFCLLAAGCAYKQARGARETQSGQAIVIENFDGYAGNGRLVSQTFTTVPQRVLAISESVVEDLLFLGLQDKIVAISSCYSKNYAPYAAEYAKLPRLSEGTAYPSKEAVLGLQPDLIVCWGSVFGDSALGSVEYWQQKGIHTYVMKNTVPTQVSGRRKVSYFLDDLEQLAKIFRVEEQNKAKIAQLRARLARLQSANETVPQERRPKVVTLQYLYGNEYYSRTDTDMTADMIELAGGIPVDDRLGGRKSVEDLVQLNPDMIAVIDTATTPVERKLTALRKHKVLQKLKAVRENKIFVVQHRAFYCGSLRTVEAVEEMHEYIKNNF